MQKNGRWLWRSHSQAVTIGHDGAGGQWSAWVSPNRDSPSPNTDTEVGIPTSASRNRTLAVVAQDPGVRHRRRIVTALLRLPYEELEAGPIGHRVHVIDYDASTGTLYEPARLPAEETKVPSNERIRGDPAFHAQNVYALVMRTLARFEFALGRRVSWRFGAHQLKVVPHAFAAANAYYSPDSESLLFGYFRRGQGLVFTCLSHDIVVHETTHALLDGLRRRFMAPSSPDQAAFHEGYADIVALLSVFSMGEVLGELIDKAADRATGAAPSKQGLIHQELVGLERLRRSILFGLAEQMEPEMAGGRANALRRSVELEPDPRLLDRVEFTESHRRGEVLVAAVMRAFLEVWTRRLKALGTIESAYLDRQRVAEEGAGVADQLLTIVIRALDYTPPIHLGFDDFLSAMLTADTEVRDDDSRYRLRETLRTWFARYGINPPPETEDGLWKRSDLQLARTGVRFGSLQTDPTEMFRLLWANHRQLSLDSTAFTRVTSVRPCLRLGPEDGLPIRETVAECIQYLKIPASELHHHGLRKPDGMDPETEVELEGGSTLILDEYGLLKFKIHNLLPTPGDEQSRRKAQDRLEYLWVQGAFVKGASLAARLSSLHLRRAMDSDQFRGEVW
jgi:hypothetical protein